METSGRPQNEKFKHEGTVCGAGAAIKTMLGFCEAGELQNICLQVFLLWGTLARLREVDVSVSQGCRFNELSLNMKM